MYKGVIKKVLDVGWAILMFPILSIFIVIVGILIKLEDHGSIFYSSSRLGKNGENFQIYKFRTMKENAPDIRNEDGTTFNGENDSRQTQIGKILRKTSIDELPQIINVLVGNMSFIGPRPDLPEHIESYDESDKEKLKVLPGITGYNQALYRNSATWKKRLENDVYYAKNVSFILDIKIIFWTIKTVLLKQNVFIENEKKD